MMRYPATDWLDQPIDPNEETEEQRDPDCPTTAEYDADPSKYIWIRPFGNQFRVYTYDTEAKDGYEIVTICDAPTMAEAEQAKTDYIRRCKCLRPDGCFRRPKSAGTAGRKLSSHRHRSRFGRYYAEVQMNGTAKLTLHQLRAVGNTGNPNRAPRLAKLAEFINDQCGDQVIATCEASETNTDRHYKGSRLRWPGKGRKGNALKVNARVELQLKGFLFGESAETFQKGQTIFEHDSSETYRHNGEAVRKTVLLVEQLILAILALMTAGCTNLYPEKSEHREREHEFMEMHMKHIGK